jgi:hypothetical protein
MNAVRDPLPKPVLTLFTLCCLHFANLIGCSGPSEHETMALGSTRNRLRCVTGEIEQDQLAAERTNGVLDVVLSVQRIAQGPYAEFLHSEYPTNYFFAINPNPRAWGGVPESTNTIRIFSPQPFIQRGKTNFVGINAAGEIVYIQNAPTWKSVTGALFQTNGVSKNIPASGL